MPLDSYVIGKTIGKGSYGEVSLARHKKDGRQFVIKKIDLHSASSKERNFAQQEVQILSKMKHPNIVAYKESFQDETGFLYIIMGYCEGGDLYRKLKEQSEKGEFLVESQIVEWFVQIAMGLQYMHDRNILHRDLKTQNIFLTKSKIIKLGDLGIARVLENTCDMATTLIGTPYYMSPEIFSNKPYNHKSDIWALGCCVYEMTSLKHAFNAKDMNSLVYKILRGKTPPMPKQYTQELCNIIRSMLAYDPAERPSVSRILRQPFIKKHIMMFLEGTRQKKRQKEDLKPAKPYPGQRAPIQGSKDSGVGDSFETESQAAATVSAVEIELFGDDKERKQPYIVKGKSKAVKRLPNDEKPSVSKAPNGPDGDAKYSARDRRRKSREEAKPHLVHNLPHVEEHRAPSLESRGQSEECGGKVGRPVFTEKDRQRSVESDQAQMNRPLPPRPDYPIAPSPQRKLSNEQKRGNYRPKEYKAREPEMSAGTPNTAARKKRRQKMKEEDIRKSRLNQSSVSTPRSIDSPDGIDSVDSLTPTQSQASTSDDDAAGSDLDDFPTDIQKHRPPHRKSSDIGNLIETLQQTLSLGQRPTSERSSPEDSVDGSHFDDKEPVSPNASGRLQDRIARLRSECIRGLGEEVLFKAYNLIDEIDEDHVEGALVGLMGRGNFEIYGGLIWQLKFCEEFRV